MAFDQELKDKLKEELCIKDGREPQWYWCCSPEFQIPQPWHPGEDGIILMNLNKGLHYVTNSEVRLLYACVYHAVLEPSLTHTPTKYAAQARIIKQILKERRREKAEKITRID